MKTGIFRFGYTPAMMHVPHDILDRILQETVSDPGVVSKADLAKIVNRISGEFGLSGSVPAMLLSERYRVLVRG